MLQEFDLEIKDRKRTKNHVIDNLSSLKVDACTLTRQDIIETFSDEQLLCYSMHRCCSNLNSHGIQILLILGEWTITT